MRFLQMLITLEDRQMNKKQVFLILALVFWLAAFALKVNAQETVRGSVRGADGTPKISASVKLNGPGNYMALTNANGEFVIENVIPGTYKVTVLQSNRYQVFTRTIPGPLELSVPW